MDVLVEPFDVKQMITECCNTVESLVENKPEVRLVYEVADEIGEARTDGRRLRQIVVNLLGNALKFTDTGEVKVFAAVDDQADGAASLVVAVSDTGTGIPPDALEKIFDEFQQAKTSDQQQGTGLGLAITKRFATLLGGSIGVESEVGKGSVFTVKIPLIYRPDHSIS